MAQPPVQRLSFGTAAAEYDAARPTYPPAALHWALGRAPLRVVDLGAGTGILTRVLLRLGHQVTAVEPDDEMRATLLANSPGARAEAGSAESIPIPDGSVDAVVAGQAYHWFDRQRAHPEIARVLTPTGTFAPLWNIRDESTPWMKRLSDAVGDQADRDRRHEGWLGTRGDSPVEGEQEDLGPLFGDQFGAVDRKILSYSVPMDADSLVALMSTRSYFITATPERQQHVVAAIRALAATLPPTFELPYRCVAYRTHPVTRG
jgi:SAM-dependent methyltransferase